MFITKQTVVAVAAALVIPAVSAAQGSGGLRAFEPLPSGVVAPEDVSAVAVYGKYLLIGADEATADGRNLVQVLGRDASGHLKLQGEIDLFTGEETEEGGAEMDIEGIAVDDDTLVVVGSHSAKRSRLKSSKSYKKNRKKLKFRELVPEPNRGRIYRLHLGSGGQVEKKKRFSLTALLAAHPVLGIFKPLPSKENGVDIEGAALFEDKLWLGFRGPVLRDNYVPVMVLDLDDADAAQLRYVRLCGRGIRGMAEVSDGLLLIAGPVVDGPASYKLYYWDGNDMVPGNKRGGKAEGKLKPLARITPPAGGKAEGITVIDEQLGSYDLLIAYDGVTNSAQVLERLQVPK